MTFPGGSFAPTRVKVVARGAATVRVGERPRSVPVRASATAELAPASDATLGGPARGEGGGYDGPLAVPDGQGDAPRRGGGVRPDGRGGAPRRPASSRSRARSAPTPSRRACSRPTRTRSGSRRPARACTATPPSSTSARPPPTPGWPPTRARSASSTATPGSPGTTGSAPTRATASTRRSTSAAPGSRPAVTTAGSTTGCRRSCRRASTTRSPRRPCAGTCRWSCWRRSSTRSRASTRSRRAPRARAGSPSSCRAPRRPTGSRIPYDPVAAIDAQAHLMSDLLKQFGGKVALALAAYNAGAGCGRALRRRAALCGDPRLRGEDPGPAGRRRGHPGRRVRGEPRGVTVFQLARAGPPGVPLNAAHGLRGRHRDPLGTHPGSQL